MSKGNTFENELLLHLFNNSDITLIGDAGGLRGSVGAGSLYVALHTAEPGEGGDQTTSEIAYTGYARVGVARSGAGWTVATNTVTNAAAVTFGQRTDIGTAVATHWSVGVAASGASKILYSGPLGTVVQGPFTALAVDNTIRIPGHSLAVDERVAFYPAFGSALPGSVVEATLYWVKTVAGDVITISTTQGGGEFDITSDGDGVAYEARTLSITQFITPSFAAGDIDITED